MVYFDCFYFKTSVLFVFCPQVSVCDMNYDGWASVMIFSDESLKRCVCVCVSGTRRVECMDPFSRLRRKLTEGIQYPFAIVSYGGKLFYTDWRRSDSLTNDSYEPVLFMNRLKRLRLNHHPTHWIDACVFVLSLGKRWLLWSIRMGWRWKSFSLRDVHAHTASPSLTHNALQAWTTAPLRTAAVRTCVSRGPADSPAAVPTPETDRAWSRTRTSERRRDSSISGIHFPQNPAKVRNSSGDTLQ